MPEENDTNLFKRVADHAKVSPSTVTLALQDSPRISLETKERVFKASRHVRYRETRVRDKQHWNFAVVYGQTSAQDTLATSPDASIVGTLANRAGELGVSLFVQSDNRTNLNLNFRDFPSMLRRDQIDGVLLVGVVNESFLAFLREVRIPVVLAGNAETKQPVDQVKLDYRQATRHMIGELLQRGHRKFAFVTAAASIPVNREMFDAFREELEHAGCFDETLVRSTKDAYAKLDLVESLFQGSNQPTLVFATTWRMANHTAILAARNGVAFDSGFEIASAYPDAISDLGYPLHLIVPNIAELGSRALERLVVLRENPDQKRLKLLVPCSTLLQAS